jgi:hypothetical protein
MVTVFFLSLDEAYEFITKGLTENALGSPRPAL